MKAYRTEFKKIKGVIFIDVNEPFYMARRAMLEHLHEIGVPRSAMDVPTVQRAEELDDLKLWGSLEPETHTLYTETSLKPHTMKPKGEQEIQPDTGSGIEVIGQRVPGVEGLS